MIGVFITQGKADLKAHLSFIYSTFISNNYLCDHKRNFVRSVNVLKISIMTVLHNRVSQKELKQHLLVEKEKRITLSFYQYFFISDPQSFRDDLYKALHALRVFGRIYVANEGINAQVSVPESGFEAFKNYLYSIEPLQGIRLNKA